MKITIAGTGNVGSALGTRWAEKGHEITFASRNPKSEIVQKLVKKLGKKAKAVEIPQAGDDADVIVIATPWSATENMLAKLGSLDAKILIDCTNPIAEGRSQLAIGTDISAGEMVQRWAPDAKVVKAFNSTGSGNMLDTKYNGGKIAMLICGDDQEAKDVVKQLAEELGFEVFDAGPLTSSRFLEPLAMLWVTLAYQQNLGPDIAFRIVKRKTKKGSDC